VDAPLCRSHGHLLRQGLAFIRICLNMAAECKPVGILSPDMDHKFADNSSLERYNGLNHGFLPHLYGLEAPDEEKYEVGTYILNVRWHLVSC
jgi:hypothetical protein